MRHRASPLLHAVVLGTLLGSVPVACLPPERPVAPALVRPGVAVRVLERGARPTLGTLVRLTTDSVVWQPAAPGAAVRAASLPAVERVEIRAPRSQRAALQRGLARGALVGGVLGGALLAVRPDAVGGAIGLTLGSAWVAGVVAGQQAESPRAATTWRVVHPRPGG